jgi:hypothetical protein
MSGIISIAFGQDQKAVKPDKAEWDKKIKTELNLTQDQTVKYDALSKEYGEKMDGLMKDASLTKKLKKKKRCFEKRKRSQII